MRSKDIIIGNFYRLKDTPDYSWIKAIEILKPREYPNTKNYTVVKCEHRVNKDDVFGFIRYFKPMNILKQEGSYE